jgi:hypothetical protein
LLVEKQGAKFGGFWITQHFYCAPNLKPVSANAGASGGLALGTAEQLRVDADLEERDEGTGGLFEGLSGEGDEGSEEGLEALEGVAAVLGESAG